MQQPRRFSFGAFELDPAENILLRQGEAVRIGRQAFRALALLVARNGALVTREELQQEIWGDRVHVDFEHGLNVCIRQVRAALGDEGNQIVITCPREGYRLGVPVTPVRTRHRVALWQWAAAAAAVLLIVAGSYLWTRTSPATNTEALDWYWRGRAYFDRANGRDSYAALPYFERAATLDATFAPAQAALAVSYLDRAAGRRLPVSLRVAPQWEPLRASSAFPDFLRKHHVGGADTPKT